MAYAKRGIVTPEMEYIAIRENLGRAHAYEAIEGDYRTPQPLEPSTSG